MKLPAWPRRVLPRVAASLCALLLLTTSARSTYSIIVVDTATGEVCVALASCHPGGVSLQRTLPVVVVGKGAAVVQALTDQTAVVRQQIRTALETGVAPQEILDYLMRADRHAAWRQIAVVDMLHAPVAITGINAKQAAIAITGVEASLHYSIQGNILVGNKVIQLAEQAFLQSRGDLGQRVMRTMETMRALGGDGRCSCSPVAPTSCGVPPPNFTKSAHTGFVVIARPGDGDGGCNKAQGCASGTYYLDLEYQGDLPDPDPVLMLQVLYDGWRQTMAGRPDHFLSKVVVADQALVADSLSSTVATIQLFDIEGDPITHGGAQVHVEYLFPGKSNAKVSPAIDNGDGTYSMTLTAGNRPGHDAWRVVVDDGQSAVALGKKLEVAVDPLVELHSGHYTLSNAAGGFVPLTINLGPARANHYYVIAASSSGTVPGLSWAGAHLPLNIDDWFRFTIGQAGSTLLPLTAGLLDANGRAASGIELGPKALKGLVGGRLDWAAIYLAPHRPPGVTLPAGFDVLP